MIKSFFIFLRSSRDNTLLESLAFANGIDSFYSGVLIESNPYSNSKESHMWINGWYYAKGEV